MNDNKRTKTVLKKALTVVAIIISAVVIFKIAYKSRNTDVHVFYRTYSDTFLALLKSGIESSLSEYGITQQGYDASANQTTQSEQIFSTLARDPKIIVVTQEDCSSENTSELIIDAAARHGTYIVFCNREVSDNVINSYDKSIYVGSKVEEAGIIQGEMIGEYLLEHYEEADLNHDGKISYILFKGQEGNVEADARTVYSVKTANEILTAAGYPELEFYDNTNPNKYMVDPNSSWSATMANEYMSSALIRYSDGHNNMIELVICNNDNMAEGTISALQKVGYNRGKGSKMIPVYGVDATENAKILISKGCMTGTVIQDAEELGGVVGEICNNILEGRDMCYGLEDIPIDENCRKLRIHYHEYTEK